MVFKRGQRAPRKGEKMSDVEETGNDEDKTATAVADKKDMRIISKDKFLAVMTQANKFRVDKRSETGRSCNWDELAKQIAKSLKVDDIRLIVNATFETAEWDKDMANPPKNPETGKSVRPARQVLLHEKVEDFMRRIGYEVRKTEE